MIKVSVVTTEKNEVETIDTFIKGIFSHSYPADELVICDGGSTDGTIKRIQSYMKNGAPVRLVIKPGNRSVGRNEAIRKARNNVIAVTDVGTVADKDWLKYLIEPFEKDPKTMVVGGFFKIRPQNLFEEVSATQMLSDHDNINPKTWLPSSRSLAFKKEAWKRVGGYPEHTKYNEDTPFDLALKKEGYQFTFAPRAIVYWRPRSTLKEFFKQYYNYAIGDGLNLIHWPNYVRKMLVYLTGAVLLAYGFWSYVAALAVLYFLRRGRRVFRKYRTPAAWVLSPAVTIANDLADILGFIRGVRLRSSKKNV